MSGPDSPTLAIDLGGTRIKAGIVVGNTVVEQRIVPTNDEQGFAEVLRTIQHVGDELLQRAPARAVGIQRARGRRPRAWCGARRTQEPPGSGRLSPRGDPQPPLRFARRGGKRRPPLWIGRGHWRRGAGGHGDGLLDPWHGRGVLCHDRWAHSARPRRPWGYPGRPCDDRNVWPHLQLWQHRVRRGVLLRLRPREGGAGTSAAHPAHPLAARSSLTPEAVFEAAAGGDELAGAALATYLRHLAAAVASYVHAYDPTVVVLGGGIMHAAAQIVPFVHRYVQEHTWTVAHHPVEVAAAALGDQAALVGAAALARGEAAFW